MLHIAAVAGDDADGEAALVITSAVVVADGDSGDVTGEFQLSDPLHSSTPAKGTRPRGGQSSGRLIDAEFVDKKDK